MEHRTVMHARPAEHSCWCCQEMQAAMGGGGGGPGDGFAPDAHAARAAVAEVEQQLREMQVSDDTKSGRSRHWPLVESGQGQ